MAWTKVTEWALRDEEFLRRADIALLATLSMHDKKAADALCEFTGEAVQNSIHIPRSDAHLGKTAKRPDA